MNYCNSSISDSGITEASSKLALPGGELSHMDEAMVWLIKSMIQWPFDSWLVRVR